MLGMQEWKFPKWSQLADVEMICLIHFNFSLGLALVDFCLLVGFWCGGFFFVVCLSDHYTTLKKQTQSQQQST